MFSKILVGAVAAGMFGVGGYLYYLETPCGSCHKENLCQPPMTLSPCCAQQAPSETTETATDQLPMPREVVAR